MTKVKISETVERLLDEIIQAQRFLSHAARYQMWNDHNKYKAQVEILKKAIIQIVKETCND